MPSWSTPGREVQTVPHSPGAPFSSYVPGSSNSREFPATKSFDWIGRHRGRWLGADRVDGSARRCASDLRQVCVALVELLVDLWRHAGDHRGTDRSLRDEARHSAIW